MQTADAANADCSLLKEDGILPRTAFSSRHFFPQPLAAVAGITGRTETDTSPDETAVVSRRSPFGCRLARRRRERRAFARRTISRAGLRPLFPHARAPTRRRRCGAGIVGSRRPRVAALGCNPRVRAMAVDDRRQPLPDAIVGPSETAISAARCRRAGRSEGRPIDGPPNG